MFFKLFKINHFLTLSLLTCLWLLPASCDSSGSADPSQVTVSVDGKQITVEPLLTRKERWKGAVQLGQLGSNQGILFVYPRPIPNLYWANRALPEQPLDMAFIDPERRISQIQTVPAGKKKIIRSDQEAQFILVTNNGWFQNEKITTGTRLSVPSRLVREAEPLYDASNIRTVTINGVRARVEIANTTDERERGLMNRKGLQENHGMIFIYPSPQVVNYYMKNTLVPLDVAFIHRDGTIHKIQSMTPLLEKTVSSKQKVQYVLEMRQGWFQSNDISPGDQVDLSNLPTAENN